MLASRIGRLAAVLAGSAAMAVGLMLGAPVANATPNDVTPDNAASAQDGRFIQLPSTGSHAVTEALGQQESSVTPKVAPWVFRGPASQWGCGSFQVCFWTGDNYTGTIYAFGGDYPACSGWRFEGTTLSNHTYSFWNRASGRVSVWNRFADGSYNYTKLAPAFAPGFRDSFRFSYVTDAWVFDPANTCTRLNLLRVP